MAENTEQMTLVQKLAKVRDIADVVKKDKQGYGYNYADITQVLAKVTAGLKKYGVLLVPMVTPETTHVESVTSVNTKLNKTTKEYNDVTTTEMVVTADMVFRWINVDNPDDVMDVPWTLTGAQSDPSQAFGSAITYCTRYFLTSYFQIGQTEEDPDSYRSKQKEAAEQESKEILESLIKEVDSMIRTYLADNEDKKEDVSAFVKRFVKSGNYTKIKEPKLVAKMITDFKEQFLNQKENKDGVSE